MAKCWKKGSLHCHTMWSDGRSLPEGVIKTYQDNGYDFVCLSDHNIFQDDENMWERVVPEEGTWPPYLSKAEFLRVKELLPENCLECKERSYKTYVRLKTFDELRREWEKKGRFLLIPGNEITTGGESFGIPGRIHALHYNCFNVRATLPIPTGGDALELTRKALDLYEPHANEHTFFMLNHPFYVMWDADPRILIEYPQICFFEINNSGNKRVPEGWICDREKYWDFVLAHRLAKGAGPVYGTSSDDAHYYCPDKAGLSGYCCTGFVMVRCDEDEFTVENIVRSMKQGDFYSSTGTLLEDVVFDNEKKTLSVKVQEEEGVEYEISFVVTGKDFSREIVMREYPFEEDPSFSRTFPVIPDDVGLTVKTVRGSEGSYTLQDDDLYVRAIITSSKPGKLPGINLYPEYETAWTQPYIVK